LNQIPETRSLQWLTTPERACRFTEGTGPFHFVNAQITVQYQASGKIHKGGHHPENWTLFVAEENLKIR
jgi:hypothetical protein